MCHRGSSPATFASKHQAPTWRVETSETAIASRTRRKRPRRVERAKKDAQGLDKSGELWSPPPLSALRPAKRMYRIFGGSSLPQARRLLFLKDEPGRGLCTFSFSPSSGLVFCIPPPPKSKKVAHPFTEGDGAERSRFWRRQSGEVRGVCRRGCFLFP